MKARRTQPFFNDSFEIDLNHGGEHSIGKAKTVRPISTRKPIHLTLRSSHAVGKYSFRTRRNKEFITQLIETLKLKWGIKIYKYSINGNHLHFALRALSRPGF
jgi:hypothetical protein